MCMCLCNVHSKSICTRIRCVHVLCCLNFQLPAPNSVSEFLNAKVVKIDFFLSLCSVLFGSFILYQQRCIHFYCIRCCAPPFSYITSHLYVIWREYEQKANTKKKTKIKIHIQQRATKKKDETERA